MMEEHTKRSKFVKFILEINDTSFFWYVFLSLILFFVDVFTEHWFVKIGVQFGDVVIFLLLSGVVKILYRFQELQNWISSIPRLSREGKLGIRILVYLFVKIEPTIRYLRMRVLQNQPFVVALPRLLRGIFLWSLSFYFGVLIIEEFKGINVEKYLHFHKSFLFFLVILFGGMAIVLGNRKENMHMEHVQEKVGGWSKYLFIATLGCTVGILTFLKFRIFGLLGVSIAFLAGILVLFFCINTIDEREENYDIR